MLRSILTVAAVLAAQTARADEPQSAKSKPRVVSTQTREAEKPPLRAADSDAPLPEGWPAATEPRKIEVKAYPAYRSAVARAQNARLNADNALFFPLFLHISRKNVAMTAPVVNTYTPQMLEKPGAEGDMSMEFLYSSTKQGELGAGVGAVRIEDHPAATFACLGFVGAMNDDVMRDGVRDLRAWLDEHKSEWTADGPPRRLGYHGPMTPEAERRWEVQLPIKPAKTIEEKPATRK